MKKKITCLILLLAVCVVTGCLIMPFAGVYAAGDVSINSTNFPDSIFRNYISSFDLDNSKSLSASEIKKVTAIDVRENGIKNLKGVEYFTALTSLRCGGNQLTVLDVSKNTALTYLSCGNNRLTSLDVKNNTALTSLYCYSNALTSIDLSKNTALTLLSCHSNNLTGLDISNNTALEEIWCYTNNLTELNITKNTALTFLNCHENKLTSLNVSKNTALVKLYCYNNQLTSLDVRNNTALSILSCYKNKLTSLDVSKNAVLTELWCYTNSLTSIDVSRNMYLDKFNCSSNRLTFLDVSRNPSLTTLRCDNNPAINNIVIKNCENIIKAYKSKDTEHFKYDATAHIISDASEDVPVIIISQPQSVTVGVNETAEFSITATGIILAYQWQYKVKNSDIWIWLNENTPTISIEYGAYKDGMTIRCMITDYSARITTSEEAVLTYKASEPKGPEITVQPENMTVTEGELAYFNVQASGEELKYLWQYKEKGKTDWTDWTKKTTPAISVAYAAYRNGMSLRCVITDKDGKTSTSDEAILSYKALALAITKHPENTTVAAGTLAYFGVKATGNGLTYLWQYKEKGKSTWTDWTSKKTANISVAYLASRNGMSLRCVITDKDGNKATSNEAVLTYSGGSGPVITAQPQNTTVASGTLAYFSVKATGNGLTYLWQYKNKDESTWTDWTSKKTAEISVAYLASRNGMSLRCVITDKDGNKVTSSEAVLTYGSSSGLVITTQPKNTTVGKNELAYFSVKATGSGLTYLWQYKNKGESTWTDWTSKKTAEISVAYLASRNGMSLRCVVTDKNGNKVTSDVATLTYNN